MAEFRIYQNEQGSLHWYLIGDSGRKLAESGEAFESMDAAQQAIDAIKYDVARAEIVDRRGAAPLDRSEARFVDAAHNQP